MKILKILLTLFILLCTVSLADAKTKSNSNENYRLEYLNLDWWQKYNDPVLTDYISTAFKNNQDLKIATLNVKQSEQVVKQAFASQLPQLGFQGDVFRDFSSADIKFGDVVIKDYSQSNFFLPLTMSYEVDIWGENYLKTKSFKKQLEMVKQNERASYISLTSAVASEYFNLVKLDKLIKNQQELVKLQTEIVRLEDLKYKNGLCPITELMDEKQLLTQLQEELNVYIDKRLIVGRQLGVLTGEREKDLSLMPRSDYSIITLLPLPDSINAEVIQYRPDFMKAEEYIQKIGIDVKVAKRDFLPKFILYGQAGFSAYNLTNIFGNHTFKSLVGFMPSIDLFTGGAKMARFRYKKLELEKAQQIYEKTILTSIQEVNNSLCGALTRELNYNESVKRYNLENDKFNLAQKKFDIGAKSNLEMMKDREKLLVAEKDKVNSQVNYLISTLSIYKAVGGNDFTTINEKL
ncbi:rND efflux system outer membrane lipoprotein NodT family [Clostridium sp. CAG:768]|nr:rND efflux system outer membrane lipoprotein NodT family [Clostridium sp. CAG:768]